MNRAVRLGLAGTLPLLALLSADLDRRAHVAAQAAAPQQQTAALDPADRHIAVFLLTKPGPGGSTRCGAEIYPEQAIGTVGKKVTWHIFNHCTGQQTVQIQDFRQKNNNGTVGNAREPRQSPKAQQNVAAGGNHAFEEPILDNAQGEYKYTVRIGSFLVDPELIIN